MCWAKTKYLVTANLFIGDSDLGLVQFKIIDERMGVIGGQLIYNSTYSNFRNDIQKISEFKGVANSDDFDFSVWLNNKIKVVPEGGIGVTDLKEYDEVYIEVGGLNEETINYFK